MGETLKYIRYLSIVIFILCFFLLRPYFIQLSGLMYGGDDWSYFAHASSMASFKWPSYKYESGFQGGEWPVHSIGPGIMAAPFVFLFSQIDRLEGSTIVQKREDELIKRSWSLFGFLFSTLFYFYSGCMLLFFGLKYYFNPKISFFAVLFMLFLQTAPLYVFRRPVLSHIYELFLQSTLIYALLRNNKDDFLNRKGAAFLVGLIVGLVCLVRYNNIFMAGIAPIVLYCIDKNGFNFKNRIKQLLKIYGVAFVLILVFKIIPLTYYGEHYAYQPLFATYPFLLYLKRILHIVFGIDWGLLYTAPFALAGFAGLFIIREKLIKKQLLFMSIPLLVNLYIVITWGGQSGWYGYRYLFFSLSPVVIYPFAAILHSAEEKNRFKTIILLCFAVSIFPLLSMLCFEGNSSTLTLGVVKDDYFSNMAAANGQWVNKTYQLEVWKTFILHPSEFAKAVFKGGLLYIGYLVSLIFHFVRLPKEAIERYPLFRPDVLIKTLILYFSPFIFYLYFKLKRNNE